MSKQKTPFENDTLESLDKAAHTYKTMAEKAIAQLTEVQTHIQPDPESLSIVTIMKHISGNLTSRWTDFLNTDGEKPWRNREQEFVDDMPSHEEVLVHWNKGWSCLFEAIDTLRSEPMNQTIFIRTEPHSIIDALHRSLLHTASHVGQIVYISKMICGKEWKSLSIPKGKSDEFNKAKMNKS